MSSLPPDIWLQVADYVAPRYMQNLYSVNSVFFNVAMDQRYQQISFSYLSRKMIWMLARLKDPLVAERVRILHLYPRFLKDAIDTLDTPSSLSLFSKVGELASLIRDQKKLIFGKHRPRLPFKFKTCRDLMQVMTDVLSGLHNLTDYHILWCGLPSVDNESPALVLSTAFRLNLQCLRLEISLEKLEHLLPHMNDLLDLEELDLFIRIDHVLDADHYDTILLMLAHMISGLRPSLRKLTVQLWEPFNLSPLFAGIPHLPLLHKLSLSIPMSHPNMGDPVGLVDFLNRHSLSLRVLSIRASELGGRSLVPNEIQLGEWMDETFSKVHLSCLASLEISLYLVPFESALLCIRRFSSTLTSLVLTGSHLSFDELEQMTAAFLPYPENTLQNARIGPVTLSPQLVDLLSERLPSLDKLELLVRVVVPSEGDVPLYYGRQYSDRDQDEGQIGRFAEEMSQRYYAEWKLRHLVLSSGSYLKLYETQHRETFLRCVPALQVFV